MWSQAQCRGRPSGVAARRWLLGCGGGAGGSRKGGWRRGKRAARSCSAAAGAFCPGTPRPPPRVNVCEGPVELRPKYTLSPRFPQTTTQTSPSPPPAPPAPALLPPRRRRRGCRNSRASGHPGPSPSARLSPRSLPRSLARPRQQHHVESRPQAEPPEPAALRGGREPGRGEGGKEGVGAALAPRLRADPAVACPSSFAPISLNFFRNSPPSFPPLPLASCSLLFPHYLTSNIYTHPRHCSAPASLLAFSTRTSATSCLPETRPPDPAPCPASDYQAT